MQNKPDYTRGNFRINGEKPVKVLMFSIANP